MTSLIQHLSGYPATASPLVTMTLGGADFSSGLAFASFISNDWFEQKTPGRIWALLIGVNVAVWCVIALEAIRRIRAVERLVRGRLAALLSTVICFAVLFSAPLSPPVVQLASVPELTGGDYVLSIVCGLVAGLAVVGMWRIHAAAQSLRPITQGAGVELYLTLQDHLQRSYGSPGRSSLWGRWPSPSP